MGQTTTVTGMFDVSGASAANRLEIRSTVDGSEAFLALAATEMGSFVDVKDDHAVPSPVLVDDLVSSGNSEGWVFAVAGVPGLGWLALSLLAGHLVWSGRRALR